MIVEVDREKLTLEIETENSFAEVEREKLITDVERTTRSRRKRGITYLGDWVRDEEGIRNFTLYCSHILCSYTTGGCADVAMIRNAIR